MTAWLLFFVLSVVSGVAFVWALRNRGPVRSVFERSVHWVDRLRLAIAVVGVVLILGLLLLVFFDSIFDIA